MRLDTNYILKTLDRLESERITNFAYDGWMIRVIPEEART